MVDVLAMLSALTIQQQTQLYAAADWDQQTSGLAQMSLV